MTDTYRIRSPETWNAARDAYLAGETAESVCARFDLGQRAFRARAAAEGWRRADQPDPEPLAATLEDTDDLDDADDAVLSHIARSQMARAARRGLVGEALRWARFGEAIQRMARMRDSDDREQALRKARAQRAASREANSLLDEVTASARSIEVQARTILATERAAARLRSIGPHDLHDLHPKSDADTPDEAPLRPMSRAERRRAQSKARKRR